MSSRWTSRFSPHPRRNGWLILNHSGIQLRKWSLWYYIALDKHHLKWYLRPVRRNQRISCHDCAGYWPLGAFQTNVVNRGADISNNRLPNPPLRDEQSLPNHLVILSLAFSLQRSEDKNVHMVCTKDRSATFSVFQCFLVKTLEEAPSVRLI